MGSKRFSGLAVLMSLIGAGIAYIVGELIFRVGDGWPDYLKIGLYFGLGAMFIAIFIFTSQKTSPQLVGYRWQQQYFKTSLKLWIPTTLIMVGGVAGLFQGIYGLEINEPRTIQDIVIAVDRSSSMTTTDPDGERFNAISTFIDNLKGDKRVALLTFNENPSLEIDFTSVSNDKEKEDFKTKVQNLNITNDGQTGIRSVVDEAYSMIKSSSRGASLILISDGAPTDDSGSDIAGLVQSYVNDEIPIYTIGMMYGDPSAESYLQEIAQLTQGKYYSTSDTTMLKEVFGKIKYNEEKGTIMTNRTGAYAASTLHSVLRVVFLVALALLMALGLGIMFDNKYLVQGMLLGALIGGLIGGLLVEKLLLGDVPAVIVRAIYWFFVSVSLMSFTWCITFKENYRGTRQA